MTSVELPLGPGIYLDVPESVYHADPCAVPSLSSGMANTLLDKCPAHAHHLHPKLGGGHRDATAAMDDGDVVHAILLKNERAFKRIDHGDYKKKVAQEERDAAREAGLTPVLVERLVELRAAASVVRQKLADRGIELDGANEATMVWREISPFGDVTCRGRMDHLRIHRGQVIDLKSSRSAHPRACLKHVLEYGYQTQRAAYVRGLERLRPELLGRVDFVFAFFEIEPPFCVTEVRLDGRFRELGTSRWGRAVNLWARCLRDNRWPDYSETAITLEAPPWAVAEEFGLAS